MAMGKMGKVKRGRGRPRKVSQPVKTFVKNAIKRYSETKRIDSTYAIAITNASTLTLLNGIAQGDEYNQRNGRKIQMSSIEWRGFVSNPRATPHEVRLMLVYDKATNGAVFADTDLLDAGNLYNCFYNKDNQGRFKILADKRMILQIASDSQAKPFSIRKKVNLPVMYDGTTNAIADITQGSLYMLCVSSDAAGGLAITSDWRISYTDI